MPASPPRMNVAVASSAVLIGMGLSWSVMPSVNPCDAQSQVIAGSHVGAAGIRAMRFPMAVARSVLVPGVAVSAPDPPADSLADQHFKGWQRRGVQVDAVVAVDGDFHRKPSRAPVDSTA